MAIEHNNPNEQAWRLLVLLLKGIATEKGITQTKIAEMTGLHQSNVARFFGLKYCPKLDLFLIIAKAVGVNFFFDSTDSDVDFNQLMEQAMTELGRRPDRLPKN